MSEIPEHGREPVPGLPDYLPKGERILWQGAPDRREFAIRALHVRKAAIYFAAIFLLKLAADTSPSSHVAYLATASAALGVLLTLSWFMARSALYTITNRRIVMRFGIALPISINLPFAAIDAVEMRRRSGGCADIAIAFRPGPMQRLSWIVMWPHARPWKTSPIQPMMRCLENADEVAEVLAGALRVHADTEAVRHAVQPAAGSARRGRKSKPDTGPGFPLPPLAGATALVAIALVSVAWYRLAGPPPEPAPIEDAVASVELYFEDRDDGAVLVFDAASGALIDELPAGSNNFLRATLRGLVRGRNAMHQSGRQPFGLYRIADGRLLLVDPVTSSHVDLWAFGETNAKAFARLLTAAGTARNEHEDKTDNNVQALATLDAAGRRDHEERMQ